MGTGYLSSQARQCSGNAMRNLGGGVIALCNRYDEWICATSGTDLKRLISWIA
jgi:hypothetical protein